MPSSMIFVGLIVMWLLILVPAVARHRQEVARPSATALSGRVLSRPPCREPEPVRAPLPGRNLEVDVTREQESTENRTDVEERPRVPAPRREVGARTQEAGNLDGWTWHDGEEESDVDRRAAGSPRAGARRYRPGRGGYDPEAAEITARARYGFRQRAVLALLILAVGTAVVAALTMPLLWWAHGVVDLLLVGYLVYLRRQVRVEESIRRRRAARISAGSRRPLPVEDDLRPPSEELDGDQERPEEDLDTAPERESETVVAAESVSSTPPVMEKQEPEQIDGPPALPRLKPMPPPPVPIGTTPLEASDDDPALHQLESLARPDYRRASGQ